MRLTPFLAASLLTAVGPLLPGCQSESRSTSDESSPGLVSDADLEHGHQHVHAGDIDHEHAHDDFGGSHAHAHQHPHRHDDDNDRLISIGHTHHSKGVTDYHARIERRDATALTLTILIEDGDDLRPVTDGPESFGAIVGSDRNSGLASRKLTFRRSEETPGRYAASVEDVSPAVGEGLTLVLVPSIELGGSRMDFSFPLPPVAEPTADEPDPAADREAPSRDEQNGADVPSTEDAE